MERLREYASLLTEHVTTLKRKIIPSAELAFAISLLDDERPTNTVDPSLIPLKPLPNSAALDEKLEVAITCRDGDERMVFQGLMSFAGRYERSGAAAAPEQCCVVLLRSLRQFSLRLPA